MKILALFFFTSLALISYSQNSKQLLWSDEFNYKGKLDSTKWNYETGNGCPGNCGWGNNELQVYSNDLKNVHVENGSVFISAIKTDGKWTSGRITTQTKYNFTHGRLEFRAKLPKGKGTWPALWMLGESISKIGWPACGEVDVMEHVGRNPGVVQSVIHCTNSFGDTKNKAEQKVTKFHEEFHIYSANWTKDKIEFFVDGVKHYTYQPTMKDDKTWPLDSPFFIIMNIAMGGNLGGEVDSSITKETMEVDYVRVYK